MGASEHSGVAGQYLGADTMKKFHGLVRQPRDGVGVEYVAFNELGCRTAARRGDSRAAEA